MATHRHATRSSSLSIRPDRPLIGVILVEDGEEVVRYFADEAEVDAAVAQTATDTRALAGAWADLDWDEAIAALDRIRHDTGPTPPIDEL